MDNQQLLKHSSSKSGLAGTIIKSAAGSPPLADAQNNKSPPSAFNIDNLIYPPQSGVSSNHNHNHHNNHHHNHHHHTPVSHHKLPKIPKRLKTPPGLENLPIPPPVVTHIPPPTTTVKSSQSNKHNNTNNNNHQNNLIGHHIPTSDPNQLLNPYAAAAAFAAALFNPTTQTQPPAATPIGSFPVPNQFAQLAAPFLHPQLTQPPSTTTNPKSADLMRSSLVYQRLMSSQTAATASYMSQLALMANLQQQQQQQQQDASSSTS